MNTIEDMTPDQEEDNQRVIKLEQIPGSTKSTAGQLDVRLFKGENKLIAFMAPSTMLWQLKYEHGILPEPLKQKFTRFNLLMDHVKHYFAKRGVKVID